MSDNSGMASVGSGRIVAMAFLHAVLLVTLVVFAMHLVPEFATQAAQSGLALPALARWTIAVSSFVIGHWFWAVPVLAAADAIALVAIGKTLGKHGLLVWSVLASGICAGLIFFGTLGMLGAISSMP